MMEDIEPWIDWQAAIVTPFTAQPAPLSMGDGNKQADPNSVQTIYKAHQNKINEHFQVVQQEVTHLMSKLRGEKGGC